MLDLAPLLLSFLEDVMAPRELLVEHTQCYKALVRILEICTMGPRKGAARSVELRQSIIDHHALYRRLYPDFIKPKFHQVLHVSENAEQLGVLLSCFVNERKHRSIKSAALWTFRYYESTLISDVVRQELERLRDETLFLRETLLSPVAYRDMLTATVARLPFGEVRKGDLIACRGRRILEVVRFWQRGGADDSAAIVVEGRLLSATDNAALWCSAADSDVVFLPSLEMVAALAWAYKGAHLRAVLPPAGLGFER